MANTYALTKSDYYTYDLTKYWYVSQFYNE